MQPDERPARIRASVSLTDLMLRYGVTLRKIGNSHVGCCIWHDETRPSMNIYVGDDGAERAKCFSCGAGGSVIDVYAQFAGLDPKTQMREILDALDCGKLTKSPKQKGKIIGERELRGVSWKSEKPPKDSRPKSLEQKGLTLIKSWDYIDTKGELLGIIARYQQQDGNKTYRPWTYGRMGLATLGWQPRTWTPLRPLYGLDRLAARPDTPVLIVEGEKAADAAAKLFPGMVCISWPGGANGISYVNWQTLSGRDIVLIPDADLPGERAMLTIASYLLPIGCKVRLVDTSGQPEHWDIADAEWDNQTALAWCRERIKTITSKECETARLEAEKKTLLDALEQQEQSEDDRMPEPAKKLHVVTQQSRHTAIELGDAMPEELSESALALYWVGASGADWAYTTEWDQWAHWDGKQWNIDRTNSVTRIVCDEMTLANKWAAAQRLTPSQRRSLCSRKNIASVIALASPRLAVLPEQWDADPMLLGVPDGVVDLRTGKMRPATKEDRITKRTAVTPAPGTTPTWDSVLARCTGGDDSMRQYYQRWIGYSLTGLCDEEGFLFIHGKGGAGKSKFVDCVGDMLGDYCVTTKIETLMESKHERHTEEIAALFGARMVRASEPEEGARWNEALLKLLTGRDTVSARRLYEKQFQFKPQFKLWINGNFRPALKSTGEEINRRMHFINFPDPVPESERIHNLPELLRQEWPAILHWAIKGCMAWLDCGLGKPEAVEDATKAYLADEDTMQQWIDDCCIVGNGEREMAGDLYKAYRKRAEEHGEMAVSQKRFSQRLDSRGFDRKRVNGGTAVLGIRLKTIID